MRRRWRKKQGRNFRSRAVGGPLRSRPGNGNCGKAVRRKPERFFGHRKAFEGLRRQWRMKRAFNFRSGRKMRGIAALRCRWQKKQGRNFRSRAVGGPLRSRPGNGNCGKAVRRKPEAFFGHRKTFEKDPSDIEDGSFSNMFP